MADDNQRGGMLKEFVTTLKSSYLLMLVTALFLLDVVIPDAIPFFDEVVLFIGTVLVARWKGRRREAQPLKPAPKDVTPPDGND